MKPHLTFRELCDYARLSESWLYKQNALGKIPGASKPGGKKLYFERSKIDAWLLGSPVEPTPRYSEDELETKAATFLACNK